jgi:hypothetical protein
MRKAAMILNVVVVIFFACFTIYTFVAKQHLNGLARAFVTRKTLEYSEPIFVVAEETLDMPIVRKLLSEKQEASIRHEIGLYNENPAQYVADLTRQKTKAPNPKKPNPLLKKVALIKERIRTFYDDTLNALLVDLRIFSFSNLVAGFIAFGLAYCSPRDIRKSIVVLSIIMFVGVLWGTYMYVDNLGFFTILFRAHMGWTYPLFLATLIVGAYWDYCIQCRGPENAPASEQPG